MSDDSSSNTQKVTKTTWQQGKLEISSDTVIEEVPVALVYNGISHVVMMVTPSDLQDFAIGFSLSEGILDHRNQVQDFCVHEKANGLELQLTIDNEPFAKLKNQRRNMTGRTGCGLCGAEALDQAIPVVASVDKSYDISHQAIERALSLLPEIQFLQIETGAVHAAAWCSLDGDIKLLREDVGRHNALDKMLGALAAEQVGAIESEAGFALVTCRASYEMVMKSARANISMLVAVSAPTSLAISMAEQCGITLVGFARTGRHIAYTYENRLV